MAVLPHPPLIMRDYTEKETTHALALVLNYCYHRQLGPERGALDDVIEYVENLL